MLSDTCMVLNLSIDLSKVGSNFLSPFVCYNFDHHFLECVLWCNPDILSNVSSKMNWLILMFSLVVGLIVPASSMEWSVSELQEWGIPMVGRKDTVFNAGFQFIESKIYREKGTRFYFADLKPWKLPERGEQASNCSSIGLLRTANIVVNEILSDPRHMTMDLEKMFRKELENCVDYIQFELDKSISWMNDETKQDILDLLDQREAINTLSNLISAPVLSINKTMLAIGNFLAEKYGLRAVDGGIINADPLNRLKFLKETFCVHISPKIEYYKHLLDINEEWTKKAITTHTTLWFGSWNKEKPDDFNDIFCRLYLDDKTLLALGKVIQSRPISRDPIFMNRIILNTEEMAGALASSLNQIVTDPFESFRLEEKKFLASIAQFSHENCTVDKLKSMRSLQILYEESRNVREYVKAQYYNHINGCRELLLTQAIMLYKIGAPDIIDELLQSFLDLRIPDSNLSFWRPDKNTMNRELTGILANNRDIFERRPTTLKELKQRMKQVLNDIDLSIAPYKPYFQFIEWISKKSDMNYTFPNQVRILFIKYRILVELKDLYEHKDWSSIFSSFKGTVDRSKAIEISDDVLNS